MLLQKFKNYKISIIFFLVIIVCFSSAKTIYGEGLGFEKQENVEIERNIDNPESSSVSNKQKNKTTKVIESKLEFGESGDQKKQTKIIALVMLFSIVALIMVFSFYLMLKSNRSDHDSL